MTAARRTRHHPGLQHAVACCQTLRLPLVVLEPLRVDYPYACARFHRFLIEGMRDNAAQLAAHHITYLPFVERTVGQGRGLLSLLAQDAARVIGDDSPAFFLPRMTARAASLLASLGVPFDLVDSCGLLPLRAAPGAFAFAHQFRRFLQKNLPPFLAEPPQADPLQSYPGLPPPDLPASLAARYPMATPAELAQPAALLASLPLDQTVSPVPDRGGSIEAQARLQHFIEHALPRYDGERSHPDAQAASGLSFWLHMGHLSPHAILSALATHTQWTPANVAAKPTGSRQGWWNLSSAADAFLDELVTWRELGFVRCHHTTDFAQYAGVPLWAQHTLEAHRADPRPHLYSLSQLENAETADPLWNAAMIELRSTGRIQNYLRMLWGKNVLAWTADPREAFDFLLHLNDKYAVDGRDPNTYTNIAWVFGAYDRPWGPERAIFGKVRYMNSACTQKKLRLANWLTAHSAR